MEDGAVRSGSVDTVASGCQHNLIENCLGNKDYVVAVSTYARQLEAAVVTPLNQAARTSSAWIG